MDDKTVDNMIAEFERMKDVSAQQRQEIQNILSGQSQTPEPSPQPAHPSQPSPHPPQSSPQTPQLPPQSLPSHPAQPHPPPDDDDDAAKPEAIRPNTTDVSPPRVFGSAESSTDNSPLSIQLESETLQKYHQRLPFRSYLENGYKKYRSWLSMTLGSPYAHHLNFCVARNLNQTKHNSMGVDLEIRYLIKRLENLFGKSEIKYYENVIRDTLKQNLDLSDVHIQTTVDSYFRNPMAFELTLSDQDFDSRLKNVPTNALDQHSFSCWRSQNHMQLNQKPYPLTAEDILNGEALAPPSGPHLGLQMLEISGYISLGGKARKARKFGVTFI